MKVWVFRLQSSGGNRIRFSNREFEEGCAVRGAKYFSTYTSEDKELIELGEFVINYFNIPFRTNVEIEI